MHCLIHYLNCYYIYLISAMCSIFCWIYYRVVVKINLYQCQCQCHGRGVLWAGGDPCMTGCLEGPLASPVLAQSWRQTATDGA